MSDLCFSWPMLNHVLSQAELMDQMMSQLGVNPAVAARIDRGTAFYEARTRCIDCPSGGSCRCWLASSEASAIPEIFAQSRRSLKSARNAKRSGTLFDASRWS